MLESSCCEGLSICFHFPVVNGPVDMQSGGAHRYGGGHCGGSGFGGSFGGGGGGGGGSHYDDYDGYGSVDRFGAPSDHYSGPKQVGIYECWLNVCYSDFSCVGLLH